MQATWRVFAIQAVLGAGLIGLLLYSVDLSDAQRVFEEANYWWVLLAFPLFLGANALAAVRSKLALQPMGRVPLEPLFDTFLVAQMVNSLVPLRLGDLLRIQVISRRYGLPLTGVTSAKFITETLFDGAAYTLLFLWTLAVFGVPQVLLSLAWTLSALILIAVLIASVFARVELQEGWAERSPIVRRLPAGGKKLVERLLPDALRGLALLNDWRLSLRAFAVTLCAWLVQAALFWTFGRAFGLDLSLADAILVMMAAAFIVSAHFIPTSIGIYEGTITGLLVILGLSGGEALAYSVGTHLMMIFFGVISGSFAMWRLRLGMHDLVVMGKRGVEQTQELLTPEEPAEPAAAG